MPDQRDALTADSTSSEDAPITRRSMTPSLRETIGADPPPAQDAHPVAIESKVREASPSAALAAPDPALAPENATTLVSPPSDLPSTPRSARSRSSRRSLGDVPPSSSPLSSRRAQREDPRESRLWVALWIVAGAASVAIGVYLALRG